MGYRRDNSQPAIAAAVAKPTADRDTRLGLQLSSRLSETLLATVQVISKLRYDNSYKPGISLACLTWTPTANAQFRAGGGRAVRRNEHACPHPAALTRKVNNCFKSRNNS